MESSYSVVGILCIQSISEVIQVTTSRDHTKRPRTSLENSIARSNSENILSFDIEKIKRAVASC